MDYLRLRPEEYRQLKKHRPVAYLPLGTLEWHGEHLPLGSDALQSHSFFLLAAERIGGIVLPPFFLGPDCREPETDLIGMDTCPADDGSYPPQKLDGSAYWVTDDVFEAMLESALSQLARAGFKVVVAHGHGPSTSCFAKNMAAWSARYGLSLMHLWNELGDQGLGFMVDHAAANETSIMMALHPDLVELSRIADIERPVGIAGDHPIHHASAEKGHKIIEAQLHWLSEKISLALLKGE